MKITTVLALVLVVGLVYLIIFNPLELELPSDSVVPSVDLPSEDFLLHEDEQGFSFEYPIGYALLAAGDSYLTVTAPAVEANEVVNVYLIEPGEGVEAGKNVALNAVIAEEKQSGGDYYFSGSFVNQEFNQEFLVSSLTKSCGSFDVLFVALVPVEASEDVEAMNYLLNSVNC